MNIKKVLEWEIGCMGDLLNITEAKQPLQEIFAEEYKEYLEEFQDELSRDGILEEDWFDKYMTDCVDLNDSMLDELGEQIIADRGLKACHVATNYNDYYDCSILTIYQIIPTTTQDIIDLTEVYLQEKGNGSMLEVVADKIERVLT